ncbi:MAG TPA: DUF3313 domain-containing protein [Kiritimatiellia bacterium]|nr:DUF3313 domain-containing protein [Kiritimatiellia bacterium]HRX07408.1 DUF3313 domain-containing protein [Kiritimatiellia bacterium]
MGWRGRMVLLVAVTGLSCTSTYQVRNAPASGFLGDYSQLERGGRGRPLLIYRDPAADFTAYKRIQIDPVAGYIGAHSRLQKIAPEDRQALLDYFHATLRKRLAEDYELVNEPGPGVLRLRVAVTDAQGSKVAMDTLSTVVPVGLALSALEKVALGKTLTAGSVRIEAEALDGGTGKRLAALVDERAGAKVSGRLDKWSKWQDARDAFDFWGDRLGSRLAELRAEKEKAGAEPARP